MKGLEQMRKSKNKSQIELARALNVSNITISRWESGKQLPDIETVIKIAAYFDCSIDDIINPPQPLTGKKASRTGAQKGASVGV